MSRFFILALATTAFASPLRLSLVLKDEQQVLQFDSQQQVIGIEPQWLDDSNEWEDIDSVGQRAPGVCAVRSINNHDGIGKGVDRYIQYSGNGTHQQGWPEKDKWVSFEEMFNNNKPTMFSSCSQYHVPLNSGQEIGDLYNAIQKIALETEVDHRFILAVTMQESNGCVRAPTSNFGVRNPGLMQDHNGAATCNEGGRVQHPCPNGTIVQMIRDGTGGTSSGDGLAGLLGQALKYGGKGSAATYYRAARMFNSGSVAGSGKLQDGVATHCYASDIANRLIGWARAPHGCHFDGH